MDELTAFDLPVTGAIPPELRGLYVRNGANPKGGSSPHWFFGSGMVHGVRLEREAVWYRNRWVKTKKLKIGGEITDPALMMDREASAANTHVVGHAGRIFALEEGHFPYEVSGELETLRCESFGGKLTTAFSAHPKLCPETNELHTFGYGFMPPYLVYHVLDAQGRLVHSAEIQVPGPTMMHDFMITRDHAIFMDLPVTFSLEKAMKGEITLGWDPDYGARIGIMPRMGKDADVRWFEIDPCYVFHPMNSYVAGDKVICDVGRHEYMWRESMNDFAPSYLHRWEFDLATGKVSERQLDDVSHAFPRVDDAPSGCAIARRASRRAARAGLFDSPGVLVKYDIASASSHDFGPASQPGEFVFAEASDSAAEDEGYAIGFVYDKARDASDFVILDAGDMRKPPVASVALPRRVPHGFHGSWIRG
jgi:carotenoid cleavage dioxygenase